jgi:hypothetical protein
MCRRWSFYVTQEKLKCSHLNKKAKDVSLPEVNELKICLAIITF